jgi:hypothetical protein
VDLTALPADLREQVEALLHAQYRHVRGLLAHNHAAVIKLAEALMLHEQVSEAELFRVLARIEARHPFVDSAAHAAPSNGTPPAHVACLYARRATAASTTAMVQQPHAAAPPTPPEEPPAAPPDASDTADQQPPQ